MTIQHAITWVAVMDSEQARFYTKGANHHLDELKHTLTATPIRTDEPTGRRELGRSYDSMHTGGRHIIEPHTSDRTLQRRKFMNDVAEFLEKALEKGKYQRLILAAPPKVLGFLRKELSHQVKEVIAQEFDKDFIPLETSQMQEQLEKVVNL